MSDPIAQLVRKIEELERRMRRMFFMGKVTDVDPVKRLVRVSDGMKNDDGTPVKTDWLPWAELSGGLKSKTLPTAGQQVSVLSPSGLLETGLVIPGFFTDDNAKPDADDDEWVLTNGKVKQSIKDKTLTVTSGNSTFFVKDDQIDGKVGSSEVSIKADSIVMQLGELAFVITSDQTQMKWKGHTDMHITLDKKNNVIVMGKAPITSTDPYPSVPATTPTS